MTISEIKEAYSVHGGMLSDKDTAFAIDISEGQDLPADGYTVLQAGMLSVSAELAPRTVRRRYVNGEKSVPLSEKRRFVLKMLLSAEDEAQSFLLSAVRNASPVKYAYISLFDGHSECGTVIPVSAVFENSAAEGAAVTVELENS